MDNCMNNSFCRTLKPETRERLCARCMISTLAEGTSLKGKFKHPMILLDGLLSVRFFDRPNTILVPGDMTLTPDFTPPAAADIVLTEAEWADYYAGQSHHCVTPITLAYLPTDLVKELLETSVDFTRAVLDRYLFIQTQFSLYQAYLYHYNAYEAVRYVLRLTRAHGVTGLTHAQIDYLSGRNRTTVTKILHEIALAEPELLTEEVFPGAE